MAENGFKQKGDALVRVIAMRDFDEAFKLVGRIAAAAEDHFRRPDMCISEFNHVRLSVSNPHHAGFTTAEMRLAERVNAVIEQHHPEAWAEV
jgi:pterin-4a-carbinolamine dehydratase